jgi:sulfatase maturation enzyme AslB (radical SAM superfamily)
MLNTHHLRVLYDLIPSTRLRALVFKMARRLKIPYLLVRIDTNNVCNLRCKMCPYSLSDFRAEPKFMDLGLFKRIAREIFPLTRVLELSCSYEPLMTKNFSEFLYVAARYLKNRSIGITTNLQLLTDEHIKAASDCRVEFFVSIDGFSKEMYESIRTGASYEKLIGNLEKINKFKKASNSKWPKLRINFTMMRQNLSELQKLSDFSHCYNFSSVFLRHLIVWPQLEKLLPESLFFHKELYNPYVNNIFIPLHKNGIRVIYPPKYDLSPASQTNPKKFTRGGCALPFFSFQLMMDGSFKICRLGIFQEPDCSYWNLFDNNLNLQQELTGVLKGQNEKCLHCVGIGATNINVNRKENYFLELEREKIINPPQKSQ